MSFFAPLFFSVLAGASPCNENVVLEKELIIQELSVLDSPMAAGEGALSFNSIFKRFTSAKNENEARSHLQIFLREWERNQTSTGAPVVPRSTGELRWIWPKVNGELSVLKAPFVLSAIVYRPDRASESDGIDGELRFVYNLVDPESRMALPLILIFEFMLPRERNQSWLSDMHTLSLTPWGPSFAKHLEKIVDRLNARGARLRINDFFLAPTWDLRDFGISLTGQIQTQDLTTTPALDWSVGSSARELASWIEKNSTAILQSDWELPKLFRTGNALVETESFGWLKEQDLEPSLRRSFSLQTCNGCHASETRTRFMHVGLRTIGHKAELSMFLQQDLKERKKILEAKLCEEPNPARAQNSVRSRRKHVH